MADETATADLYLPFLTLTTTTKQKGLAELTFPVLTADGAGIISEIGTLAETLPGLSLSSETLYGDAGEADLSLDLYLYLSAQGVAGQDADGSLSFPSLVVSGDDFQGGLVDVDLPKLTFAGSGLTGQAGSFSEDFPRVALVATGVIEGDNAASLIFPSLDVSGSGNQEGLGQGDLQVSLFTLQGEGLAGEAGESDLTFPVFTITTAGGGSYAGTAAIILPAFILEAGGERDLAASLVGGIVDISVYSMNLSNFGVSTFSNYPFNSYCLFKGSYLGAKVDGIYLLSGQQDSAANIEVEMLQSAIGQEASSKKGIPVIYADLETDGQFDLTIQSEDQEQAYPGIPYHSGMRLQKVKVGRGLKGRYFGIGLKNRDGAKMRVNSLEIPVDVSPSRKGR